MAACPFCQSSVEDQLVVYGGRCPHCFGDIPGEETPTDPGEEARRAQERADAAKVRRSKLPLLLVSIPVLLLPLLVAGYLLARPAPPLAMLDLDDAAFGFDAYATIVVAREEPEEVAAADTQRARPQGAPTIPRPSSAMPSMSEAMPELSGGTGDGPVSRGFRGSREDGTAEPEGLQGRTSAGAGLGDSPSRRLGGGSRLRTQQDLLTQLSDPAEIRDMIVHVMRAEFPLLQRCYDTRLRRDPDFSGSWQLELTIGTDGLVSDAKATGLQRADAEFESCLEGMVNQWVFQPIRAPQPVTRRVDFFS